MKKLYFKCWKQLLIDLEAFFITSIFSIIMGIFIFCISYYVHEAGHFFIGFIINILYGYYNLPHITETKQCYFMKVPQQTSAMVDSVVIPFAGPIVTILVFFWLSLYLSKKFERISPYIFLLVPILFSIREIIANIFFGTDNHTGNSILSYTDYPLIEWLMEHFTWALMIVFFIILYPIVKAAIIKYLRLSLQREKERKIKREFPNRFR